MRRGELIRYRIRSTKSGLTLRQVVSFSFLFLFLFLFFGIVRVPRRSLKGKTEAKCEVNGDREQSNGALWSC